MALYGMDHIQAIKRPPLESDGIFEDKSQATHIQSMQLGSTLDKSQQIRLAVENTSSAAFQEKLKQRRLRTHPFFFKKPPQVLDVCQVPVQVSLIK
ncbi:MAG: hypothetical protein COW84_09410 [Gammaproteobacteria bacterium CG22_combo_CG10-13_8_21_14_all_40_8]|nr:MAG: hypothetical protein COW84_09410 [Gammaproteobacteria bacterium CG22_combo_CG10-13_8_21_14_all_40_8]